MRLTENQLKQRLRYDFDVVRAMRCEWIRVDAFRSAQDAQTASRPIIRSEEGGEARNYRITFGAPTLAGPGQYLHDSVAVVDLLAGGNYPYSTPVVVFVSTPMPWHHRVHPTTGSVCLGRWWSEANGRVLLAHLVAHLARQLNFDEPQSSDGGYNSAALQHWRAALEWRPLTPGLAYPVLPTELTHGVPAAGPALPGFRVKVVDQRGAAVPGFRVKGVG